MLCSQCSASPWLKSCCLRVLKQSRHSGGSHKPQQAPISKPIPFRLGPLRDTLYFLLSSSAPVRLLGQDFLEKYLTGISFSPKGETILEFDSSDSSKHNSQLDKLNDLQYLLVIDQNCQNSGLSKWSTGTQPLGRGASPSAVYLFHSLSGLLLCFLLWALPTEQPEQSFTDISKVIFLPCSNPCNSFPLLLGLQGLV